MGFTLKFSSGFKNNHNFHSRMLLHFVEKIMEIDFGSFTTNSVNNKTYKVYNLKGRGFELLDTVCILVLLNPDDSQYQMYR